MKENHKINNSSEDAIHSAFNALISMVFLMVFIITCTLGYAFLKKPIDDYLDKPKFSEAQKEAMVRRSQIARSGSNEALVKNGIHVSTGMVYDDNFALVRGVCTSCHSPKLITQNRATRTGWKQMIVWMQETQGLPDLGSSESKILDYLSTHYAPKEEGRRANIDIEAIECYVLKFGEE